MHTPGIESPRDRGPRRGRRRRNEQERYHHLAVLPVGLGATFHVRFGRGEPQVSWTYDAGVTASVRDTMTMERATAELTAAFGQASPGVATPRPQWMGSFVWVPPLPDAPP